MMMLQWILFDPKCSNDRMGSPSGFQVVGEVKVSKYLDRREQTGFTISKLGKRPTLKDGGDIGNLNSTIEAYRPGWSS